MNKKALGLILLPLIFGSLTSCGKVDTLEIELEEIIPTAYVGEEYDFEDCFIKEEGYTYSIDVYAYHGATYTETKLDVEGLCFTPLSADPISVVLHGEKGKTKLQKTVSVDVAEKGDPLEELFINTGLSGYADPGFQKTLNTQVAYKREGANNKTSLAVSYSGNQNYYAGGAVFCPNNFRCLEYWKDKDWNNAILKFWVYNDSDYPLEFGLRIKDEYTGTVDLDMTQEGNPSKTAAAHEWTEILFPLRPLGITHTLFQNEEGTRNDSFTIKVKYGGVTYYSNPADLILHPIPMHSYNFYIDEIDIVPASDYPDIPTFLPDTMDRMINGTWCEHFNREICYEKDYIHEGESSIKFDFVGPTSAAGSQGMCLNDPKLVPLWEDQVWDNAIMNFWLYNASNANINVQFLLVDSERNFVVDWNTEYSVNRVAEPGKWTHIFFSMNRIGVNRPLYKDSIVKDEFNVKFLWDGPTNTPYTFYVDAVNVEDASKYPEVDTTKVVPSRIETLDDGWENMLQDDGWERGQISTEMNEVCTSTNPNSATSIKIQFMNADIGSHNANPDFVLSPEAQFGVSSCPNFTGKTFEFDVKFSSNITDHSIGLKIVPPSWTDKIYQVTPVTGEDGWEHVSIDFSAYASDAETLQTVIRIGFVFNGIDEANKSTAVAYIDNIFLK